MCRDLTLTLNVTRIYDEIILIERSVLIEREYAVTLTRFSKIICSAERIFIQNKFTY